MSVTLTITEKAYEKLRTSAKANGKQNVEEFLEEWDDETTDISVEELARRKELGEQLRQLRERVFLKHGIMRDSTDLIREDRER